MIRIPHCNVLCSTVMGGPVGGIQTNLLCLGVSAFDGESTESDVVSAAPLVVGDILGDVAAAGTENLRLRP